MMAPRRIDETDLHAFVDGELSPEERAEVEATLTSSPADLQLVRDVRDINEALKQRYAGQLSRPLPPGLQKPLARLVRRSSGFGRRFARFAAGIAVVAAAGAAGYGVRGMLAEPSTLQPAFVTTALGAHTLYVPEVRHPVEVKAEEAHLVRWLAKRVGADVRAPALADLGWRLMGGRLLPDHGLAAAQFMYEDASGRRLTLYVRKETGLNNTSFRFYEKDGFGSFYWIDRPLAYALSGRLSRDELTSIANVVYAQLEAQDGGKVPAEAGKAR